MVHARSRLFLFGLLLLALAGATSACNRRVNPAKATLKELFAATPKAHPPPPYEKIFPGMSTGAANLIDADLVPAGGGEHITYSARPGLTYALTISKKQNLIKDLTVGLDDADAEQSIEAAWGAPTKGVDPVFSAKPASFWFDPAAGLAAHFTKDGSRGKLRVVPYMPVAKLIGTSKQAWGFETKPVMGATFEEVKATYGQWDLDEALDPSRDYLTMFMLPTECGRVMLVADRGPDKKIKSWGLDIDYTTVPSLKPEVLSAMKARLGEPKAGAEPNSYVWEAKPKVAMVEKKDSWRISVGED